MADNDLYGQYSGDRFVAELKENLKEYFPENDDLSYEELLGQQESVYQSFQNIDTNIGWSFEHGQSNDSGHLSGHEGESSHRISMGSLLALDEAFARSLQLGDDSEDIDFSELVENSEVNSRETTVSSSGTTVRTGSPEVSEDEIDPDEMTYEDMQSLRDSIGVESQGLSEELISRLPSFQYNTGLHSNKETEQCVICCMNFENGDYLTTLPCAHQYHSGCIKTWLESNKTCPICIEEVRDG